MKNVKEQVHLIFVVDVSTSLDTVGSKLNQSLKDFHNILMEKDDFKRICEIESCEGFFRGETIPCNEKGWTAVTYCGYPIGWGKGSEGVLKNHFPKYLRF